MLILDEFARLGVRVLFSDAPAIDDDDPQARLLTQVQGVIAEYERAKIAERYRRGKLYRSRIGEVISWKTPYGYRRVSRSAEAPARLEVFEPEAVVVRRIFDDYVAGGHSMREITRRLNADDVATPTGKPVWGTSTIGRMMRNEAYVGRVYFNRTEAVPSTSRTGRRSNLQRPRPREEWIAIACPPILADEVFEAAQRVSRDNSKWSPRNVGDEAWLLRGLILCGSCGVGTNCHKMRGRNGTVHRYYWCRNHDPLRAGGEHHRCPERNIRADALDTFVFDQVRAALISPEVLLAGEAAVVAAMPLPDDELLAAELGRLERKLEANQSERRRVADLYQAGLVELAEVQRRARDIEGRHARLGQQRDTLVAQRHELAVGNRIQQRVADFARRATAGIDMLDFGQRQQLMRLLVEHVRVSGWKVEIQLRIPLDGDPPGGVTGNPSLSPQLGPIANGGRPESLSSKDRLRSVRGHDVAVVQEPVEDGGGQHVVAEDLAPLTWKWHRFV